jgi:sugar/nucleoside kinase (ribokinase family)
VLGEDELSRFSLAELEKEGVDCAHVLHREGARPFHSVILVVPSNGQRTVLSCNGGVQPLLASELDERLIADCRVMFVDHTAGEGGLAAARLAQTHGAVVVADIEARRGMAVDALLEEADHLIVGALFASQVTGEARAKDACRVLAAWRRGSACTAITAGEAGCWFIEDALGAEMDGVVRHVSALKVQVVDTTGCGDVFHGAYAVAILEKQDIQTAIRFASVAAGLKAAHPGGRSGIPCRAEVDKILGF